MLSEYTVHGWPTDGWSNLAEMHCSASYKDYTVKRLGRGLNFRFGIKIFERHNTLRAGE